AQEYVAENEPGLLIKSFLADIGLTGLSSRQRRKAGHRGAIEMPSFEEYESHLNMLDSEDFRPESYLTKKYVPRGTIRTDGFLLQILCFKRRELYSVKYKRLPEDRLPSRLVTTFHGTGDYLTEIRNVLSSPEDVTDLWPNVDPRSIKILALDAGQAFVVGAYAHLPHSEQAHDLAHKTTSTFETPSPIMSATTLPAPPQPSQILTQTPSSHQNTAFHHNLAVNQKAVMQPTFRWRRWLEEEKTVTPEGFSDSVAKIESQLPPLRGADANVNNYVAILEQVEDQLVAFYNGKNNKYKRNMWDAERSKYIEYQ
ncbi:hypothetical protein FBU30_002986, partial [Linnemannia zychae]